MIIVMETTEKRDQQYSQAMSIRPDLLPSSFLFELQKLCDAVPSFPTQVMIMIMMIRAN